MGFKQKDAAGQFLEAHGETFEAGNKLKASATDLADSAPQISKKHASRKPGKINLRKVAEVLESYGMDPTEEILKVVPELDADTRARVMLGLLEYVQPRLKSVEMKVEGNITTMTPEQREARILELQKQIFVQPED